MSKLSEYSKFDHLVIEDDDDDDNNKHMVVNDSFSTVQSETSTSQMESSFSIGENVIRHVQKYPITASTTNSKNLRFMVQYNGNTVYEWEQSLNEVIIYIVSPLQQNNHNKSSNAKIFCNISATHLQVGIQQQQPTCIPITDINSECHASPPVTTHCYIDEDIYHPIEIKESTWCIEQEDIATNSKEQEQQHDVITIYLQKVAKGLVWEAPLRGRTSIKNGQYHSHSLDPIALQDVQKSLLLERWQEENPGMDFRDASFNGGSIPDPRTYMGGIGYQ